MVNAFIQAFHMQFDICLRSFYQHVKVLEKKHKKNKKKKKQKKLPRFRNEIWSSTPSKLGKILALLQYLLSLSEYTFFCVICRDDIKTVRRTSDRDVNWRPLCSESHPLFRLKDPLLYVKTVVWRPSSCNPECTMYTVRDSSCGGGGLRGFIRRPPRPPPHTHTRIYEGPAKSSVTNRLPKFYPRYVLKCFTALEWWVE